MKRIFLPLATILICLPNSGCSTTGSAVVMKEEGVDSGIESDTGLDSTYPVQPTYTSWTAERTIAFPSLCEFVIREEGSVLTDPEHELVAFISRECPACQVYEVVNSPESVECGDLGTLPTGGTRYRVLSFTEQYEDGTLNTLNGDVELWHAISPDWQLDYIADAVHIGSQGDNPIVSSWQYSQEGNFQAFTFSETSTFTLSE